MRKLFTDEQIAYLREIAYGHHSSHLAKMINEKFGTNYTGEQIKNVKARHKIRSGKKLAEYPNARRLTTPEQNDWIRERAYGKTNEEISAMLKEQFGIELTPEQLKGFRGRNKINNGLDMRFRPGRVPMNKGVKMSPEVYAKCAATMFKKGNVPGNHKPVGSERVTVDGYIEVKVAEPRKWALKHRVVWEKAHGPIPRSHIVTFMDGNQLNCELDNLVLISRAVHGILNCHGMRSQRPSINKVYIRIAELRLLKSRRMKDLKKRK